MFKNSKDSEVILSGLIDGIYAAALNPHKWHDFIADLDSELDGVSPTFITVDAHSSLTNTIVLPEYWQGVLPEYFAHFHKLNPWAPFFANQADIGEGVLGEEIILQSDLIKTEFYNDFFRQLGDWTGVVGITANRTPTSIAIFALHCSQGKMKKETQQLKLLSQTLAPHISRAFDIARQLDIEATMAASLELVLENVKGAALLVNKDLNVLHANSLARKLFTNRVLILDKRSQLSMSNTDQNEKLQSSIRAVFKNNIIDLAPKNLMLGNAEIDDIDVPLNCRIIPASKNFKPLSEKSEDFEQNKSALVIFSFPQFQIAPGVLEDLYGFTKAETRLAKALCSGMPMKEIAKMFGREQSTLRTQLKSMFVKTNTHSQVELISLISSHASG